MPRPPPHSRQLLGYRLRQIHMLLKRCWLAYVAAAALCVNCGEAPEDSCSNSRAPTCCVTRLPDLAAAVKLSAGQETVARLLELGKLSDSKERLQRTFFSPAHRAASALVASWMEEAGLRTWTDVVGNVHGRADCDGACEACGGALVFGSHYDTVLDAGLYDGPLGVLAAVSAVKVYLRELARPPPCPVGAPRRLLEQYGLTRAVD
jgi:hypothetical protein